MKDINLQLSICVVNCLYLEKVIHTAVTRKVVPIVIPTETGE